MRISKSYIMTLIAAAAMLSSCSKEEVDYYDKSSNGIYFNYDSGEDLSCTVNFADSVLTSPAAIERALNLRLLGYVSDSDRKFSLKTRAVEGCPLADVSLEDGVLPAGETDLQLKCVIAKPEEQNVTYAVELYLDAADAQSDLGEGIEGFDKFTVYVKEEYTEPDEWAYPAGEYLGEWTAEKYVFMARLTGMTDFYTNSKWYSGDFAHDAVEAVRAYNREHPDAKLTLGIPFSSDITYEKPSYWTDEHTRYLGEYDSSVFTAVANAVGATTDNEEELLTGDDNRMRELNKAGISYMMEKFNQYYWWQMAPSGFKHSYPSIPMFADVDYDVIEPVCWASYSDTYAELSKYWGEYSDEKYKFMLSAWLASTDNTDDYAFVQLFPIYYGWDSTWSEQGVFWDESMGGETYMRSCYDVIKAEYDKNAGSYGFSFPSVE